MKHVNGIHNESSNESHWFCDSIKHTFNSCIVDNQHHTDLCHPYFSCFGYSLRWLSCAFENARPSKSMLLKTVSHLSNACKFFVGTALTKTFWCFGQIQSPATHSILNRQNWRHFNDIFGTSKTHWISYHREWKPTDSPPLTWLIPSRREWRWLSKRLSASPSKWKYTPPETQCVLAGVHGCLYFDWVLNFRAE